MTQPNTSKTNGSVLAILTAALTLAAPLQAIAQGGDLTPPPVELELKDSYTVSPSDAKTDAIVAAAESFIATLTAEQREAAMFDFSDNAQRSLWSNFPDGAVQRNGVTTGDLTEEQRAALDALLAEVMSEDGVRNIVYQLAGEDTLDDGAGGMINFGSEFYYTSFLGTPSTTEPWMLQFGGHHLAINVTVAGSDISFAPMLTGGEPLKIEVAGVNVYTTEEETAAAQALLESLTEEQKTIAVRGDAAIDLLLGPGEDATTIASEGIKADDLSTEQQALLVAVIEARLGFINDDDFAAKMETVQAELPETYFGWWGPQDAQGAAYFRVTGPSLVLEYAPQAGDGDPTDHAHNVYRDPTNDYGAKWIAEQ